jgi:hypothetical protein
MGLIRKDFGKVAVESRRESFFVHWGSDDEADVELDRMWSDFPHPEFSYESLDDLIAALTDLRDNDQRYKEWRASRA